MNSVGMLVLAWVFLVPGHWYRAIPVLAAFVGLAYVDAKLRRDVGSAACAPNRKLLGAAENRLRRSCCSIRKSWCNEWTHR